MTELPKRTVKRLMKTQTDKKISEDAVKSMKDELETLARERSHTACNIAEELDRKTIRREDLREAKNQ